MERDEAQLQVVLHDSFLQRLGEHRGFPNPKFDLHAGVLSGELDQVSKLLRQALSCDVLNFGDHSNRSVQAIGDSGPPCNLDRLLGANRPGTL